MASVGQESKYIVYGSKDISLHCDQNSVPSRGCKSLRSIVNSWNGERPKGPVRDMLRTAQHVCHLQHWAKPVSSSQVDKALAPGFDSRCNSRQSENDKDAEQQLDAAFWGDGKGHHREGNPMGLCKTTLEEMASAGPASSPG